MKNAKIGNNTAQTAAMLHSLQQFTVVIVCCCTLLAACSAYYRARSTHDGPVTPDMLSFETKTYDTAKYNVSKEEILTTNKSLLYRVTVGEVSFVITPDEYEQHFDQNLMALDTSIHVLTITNNEPYPLAYFGKNTIDIVHLSCLGEGEFSTEQIEAYKRDLCPVLTQSKRNRLGFKDERDAEVMLWDKMLLRTGR